MANLGFIVYRGPSLIGEENIIGVLTLQSSNRKLGGMAQLWIMPESQDPLDAVQDGRNTGACGTCPLQGTWNPEKRKIEHRVCYVVLGQAPKQIWRSYRAGRYPYFNRTRDEVLLKDREIRLGAYGDPAALPTDLVRYLATVGKGWTGYSHQLFWIDQRRARALSRYLMVSCHTPAQHAEARRRGWRSFVAIHSDQDRPEGAVECPNYTHGVQCADCQLCQGTSKRARDIFVVAHGKVGANLPIVQRLQGELV